MEDSKQRVSRLYHCCLFLAVFLASCAPLTAQSAPRSTPTPFQPLAPTGTPFRPIGATLAPTPTASPTPSNPYLWHSLDVAAGSIQLTFTPGMALNGGRELALGFRPGWPCRYEDHRACISTHLGGRLILVTLHSGVGGEGDGLRNMLEGTGLNRAGLPLARIQANLSALQGAAVRLEGSPDDLRVQAAVRVPPSLLEQYYRLSVDDALAMLAKFNPELDAAIQSGHPLLAIETCGWRHPEEPWAPGVSDTSGAIYVVVVG